MEKKVLAFDMDGTILLTDHMTFNPHAIEAIREAKSAGHHPIIATGRALEMIVPLLDKNNIKGVFDYIVCNNGSYTYDVANDKIITSGEVPKTEVYKLLQDSKKTFGIFCAHSSEGKFLCMKSENVEGEQSDKIELALRDYYTEDQLIDFIENNTIVQSSLRNHKHIIREMAENLHKFEGVDSHIANDDWVDLNPLGASKLVGLELVSGKYNIPLEHFIAFGDSGNDLQMLEGAGTGIAMGNATDQAKEVSDIVIGHNDSDAIAVFIRETILNK